MPESCRRGPHTSPVNRDLAKKILAQAIAKKIIPTGDIGDCQIFKSLDKDGFFNYYAKDTQEAWWKLSEFDYLEPRHYEGELASWSKMFHVLFIPQKKPPIDPIFITSLVDYKLGPSTDMRLLYMSWDWAIQ
jgi:hypothetical protein